MYLFCWQYWTTCVIHFTPMSITKLFRFAQCPIFIQLFLKQASRSFIKKAQHFVLSFVTLVGNWVIRSAHEYFAFRTCGCFIADYSLIVLIVSIFKNISLGQEGQGFLNIF